MPYTKRTIASPARKKKLPELGVEVARVSDMDGLKIYFKNDGRIIARWEG